VDLQTLQRQLGPQGVLHEAASIDRATAVVIELRSDSISAVNSAASIRNGAVRRPHGMIREQITLARGWIALSGVANGAVDLPGAANEARFVAGLLTSELIPAGVARFKARLDLAQRLGMRLVIGSGGEATEEDRPALMATLRGIGDYAAARSLTVCLETHPGVTNNAAQMLRTMQELQHPAVRLNFDTANILYYNEGADVLAELRTVLPYIGHVHLKDSRGRLRDWYFPALGEGGAVDFAAVGRILNDGGFFGPFSIELEGIQDEPELTLDERQDRLQRSVDHLRKVGFL